MSTLRSISLSHNLCLKDLKVETSRNIYLYDVDIDGDFELVVGCWNVDLLQENGEMDAENSWGSLYVIKHGTLWKAALRLGIISCLTVGDVTKENEPWILALCADSYLYAFDAADSEAASPVPLSSSVGKANSLGKCNSTLLSLKQVHQQALAYNAKDICLFSGGGICNIAVAHSDRIVRLYTWSSNSPPTTTCESRGHFLILIKWELAGQVNRIITHWIGDADMLLIASQPGGGFAVLQRKFEKYGDKFAPTLVYYPPQDSKPRNAEARTWLVGNVRRHRCHRDGADRHCPGFSVGVTAPLAVAARSAFVLALCLSDGNLQLVELGASDESQQPGLSVPKSETSANVSTVQQPGGPREPKLGNPTSSAVTHPSGTKNSHLLWSFQVNLCGELFGLTKTNLLQGSDDDVVCVCAWDGTTYLFNSLGQLLRLPLGQSCQAFTAGYFARTPGHNEPVLVYVTSDNQLLIYYSLQIPRLGLPSCLPLCDNDIDANDLGDLDNEACAAVASCRLMTGFKELGVDTTDRDAVRRIIRYLLYAHPKEFGVQPA